MDQCAPLYSMNGPAHQLRLRLEDVEGAAAHLGEARQQEDGGPHRLQQDVPLVALPHRDLRQVQRPRQHRNRHGDDDQGDLVADELRCAAKAAHDAVLVRGGPARHDQPDDGDHGHGEDVEQAKVHVPQDEVRAEGHGHPHEEARDEDRQRGQPVDGLVHPRGHDVLFDHQLQGVGDGLQQAEGAHAHRANALLDARQRLALQPRQREHDDAQDGQQRPGAYHQQQRVLAAQHHGQRHQRDNGNDSKEEGKAEDHRSTSPRTMSREPRIMTASAT